VSRQTTAAIAAIVGAAVGLATLVGVVYALRESENGSEQVAPSSSVPLETVDTTELPPTTEAPPVETTRTVEVGGTPSALAVGEGGVWVKRDGKRLLRLDPATGEIVARVGVSEELGSERPCGVATGSGVVWVTTATGAVGRINPEKNRLGRLIPIDDAACVAVDEDAVWVTSPNRGIVTRIDPKTNEVVTEIEVSGFPEGVVSDFGSVWVASPDPPDGVNGVVSRIDPETNEVVLAIPVDNLPEYLATGEGGVWVTSNDGTVKLIEPSSDQLLDPPARVADGGQTSLAVGGGFVWATAITGSDVIGSVSRIDPETSEVTGDPIVVGKNPLGLAFGEDALWVANAGDGTVTIYTPSPT
jgi:streptogramin lyase